MDGLNRLDPITVEVIRNYFISTANQMRSVLIRTSFNPVIYEMVDFSVGLYNKRAELIAEGVGLPVFMGTQTFAIKHVIEHLGEDNVNEGDVILTTYSYWIGSHSQDACIIKPVFIDGEIFAYTATKAHWMDLGASDIYGVSTTDIWQEGLQIYAAKICKKGVIDPELVDILRANSRVPDGIVGDLNAQISSCTTGERKLGELVKKHGKETVDTAIDRILDHGEEIVRQSIQKMPDGEWSSEGVLDNNGIDDDPVRIFLKARIEGDEITIDTTGSAKQQKGPVNCPFPSTVSGCRLLLKQLTEPLYPTNEGCFRPLKVIAEKGSIFYPAPPAPVFLYGWPIIVIVEAGLKAFADVIPDRVVARSGGDMAGFLFSGICPETGKFFASGADEACGAGASIENDGENALITTCLAAAQNIPIEVMEERYPVMVLKYGFRPDSAGAGKYRGGLGVEKFYRAEIDLSLVWIAEQSKTPAWGLFGGKSALPTLAIASPGTERETKIFKVAGHKIQKGDEWHVRTGGGGGWGDPFKRDAEAVLRDVVSGYVSIESARKDYGVEIIEKDPGDLTLDLEMTKDLRADRKSHKSNQG